MPTPVELILDPLSQVFIAIYCLLMLWEALAPARKLPEVKFWQLKGLLSFTLYFYLSSYLPLWWDGELAQWQLLNLTDFPLLVQIVFGLFMFELLLYVWHRSMHAFTPLWRSFHQMHHSAERLDTFGAFWFSPLDMIGFTFIGSLALVLVMGVDAAAATAIMLFTFFLGVFQHANVRTPRWLGYLVQRPESHSYHHGKGLHRNNYADLPLFDMLFGTFVNPQQAMETGFYQGASERVGDMLLCRDVYREPDPSSDDGKLNPV